MTLKTVLINATNSFLLNATHDESVLELFYKSLYQLYNLKSTLEAEGLDNYVIDYHRIEIVKNS